jgi:ComF family protein
MNRLSRIAALSTSVLNVLFPIACVACMQKGAWLCHACRACVPITKRLCCVRCAKASPDGRICSACPVVGAGLHALKYGRARVLAPPLASFLDRFRDAHPACFQNVPLYIPVPLHVSKEGARGFNQAHLLLAFFLRGGALGSCGCWLLKRSRRTIAQAQIPSARLRARNVEGAFSYSGTTWRQQGRVVLVDDVGTTGETITQCAQILRQEGARDIWAFVLAKG